MHVKTLKFWSSNYWSSNQRVWSGTKRSSKHAHGLLIFSHGIILVRTQPCASFLAYRRTGVQKRYHVGVQYVYAIWPIVPGSNQVYIHTFRWYAFVFLMSSTFRSQVENTRLCEIESGRQVGNAWELRDALPRTLESDHPNWCSLSQYQGVGMHQRVPWAIKRLFVPWTC